MGNLTYMFEGEASDLVVHNDFTAIAPDRHAYELHRADGPAGTAGDSRDLARALGDFLERVS